MQNLNHSNGPDAGVPFRARSSAGALKGSRPEGRSHAGLGVIIGFILVLLALILLPSPAPHAEGLRVGGLTLPSGCPFHFIFGVACPLCGLTRSVACLVHGRLADSPAFPPRAPPPAGC